MKRLTVGLPLSTSLVVMSIIMALLVSLSEALLSVPVPDPPETVIVNTGLSLSTAPVIVPDLLVLPAKSETLSINSTLGVSLVANAEGSVKYTFFLKSVPPVTLIPTSAAVGVNTAPASVVILKAPGVADKISSSKATTILSVAPVFSAVVPAL